MRSCRHTHDFRARNLPATRPGAHSGPIGPSGAQWDPIGIQVGPNRATPADIMLYIRSSLFLERQVAYRQASTTPRSLWNRSPCIALHQFASFCGGCIYPSKWVLHPYPTPSQASQTSKATAAKPSQPSQASQAKPSRTSQAELAKPASQAQPSQAKPAKPNPAKLSEPSQASQPSKASQPSM